MLGSIITGLGHGCFSVGSNSKNDTFAFTTAKEGLFLY